MSYPVTAHRGLARIFPENTRASVLGALLSGLDKVEIDIQMSSDGVPIVMHDATLQRMSGRPGDVRKLSWSKLKDISAHEPGRFGRRYLREKISSLADLAVVLEHEQTLKTLFVELKEESLIPFGRLRAGSFGRERMLQAVAEALGPIHARCVLISFDVPVLTLARQTTRFRVGPVLRTLKQWKSPAVRALKADWVFCNAKLLPKQGSLRPLFGAAHSCVYEVPDVLVARALLQRGVTALETFKADTLAQELSLFR